MFEVNGHNSSFNFQQLFPYMSHPGSVGVYLPESNCKLSKARQAISYAAECAACIPHRSVMSCIHKVRKSVIQGQQNKAANGESKYITAHFSPPELNWQR